MSLVRCGYSCWRTYLLNELVVCPESQVAKALVALRQSGRLIHPFNHLVEHAHQEGDDLFDQSKLAWFYVVLLRFTYLILRRDIRRHDVLALYPVTSPLTPTPERPKTRSRRPSRCIVLGPKYRLSLSRHRRQLDRAHRVTSRHFRGKDEGIIVDIAAMGFGVITPLFFPTVDQCLSVQKFGPPGWQRFLLLLTLILRLDTPNKASICPSIYSGSSLTISAFAYRSCSQ